MSEQDFSSTNDSSSLAKRIHDKPSARWRMKKISLEVQTRGDGDVATVISYVPSDFYQNFKPSTTRITYFSNRRAKRRSCKCQFEIVDTRFNYLINPKGFISRSNDSGTPFRLRQAAAKTAPLLGQAKTKCN
ncbi:hypothetical protein T265_12364 [Opisthorchis viverrini]|uniref:Uncharacterized protein n=1 Tax=Opisthorchis viverrini TaxID=6198 RepID=A0A074YTL3_OPIVI|nr:hypothetical protein T265_12364 [Opisthorchis viverrini]KER18131.1 hypothetical protein T265_12364 [Opisthorchis viverrini]